MGSDMTIFEQYQANMVARRLSPDSVSNYRYHYGLFTRWLDAHDLEPASVRRGHLEAYLLSRDWKPATQRTAYNCIRAAYTWAVDMELLEASPCRRVRLAPEPEPIPRTLPVDRLRAIWAACRTADDQLMFRLLAYTGARRCELCALTWNDVDAGWLLLRGKGRRERRVPAHPLLLESLRSSQRRSPWVLPAYHGGPLGRAAFSRRVQRLAGVGCHDFRRTFATSLRVNGVPVSVIQTLLGHSRGGTVFDRHYNYVAPVELEAAVLRAYADDPV
jgi:integrase